MRLALAALLLFSLAARAQSSDGPRRLADDSRWASFVHLVESRWRSRTEVPPDNADLARRLAVQCVADAWYLAVPGLLDGRKSPCGRLVAALPEAKVRERELEKLRTDWRAKFRRRDATPSRDEYAGCTSDALANADVGVLMECALAIGPRATLMASLSDDDRFGGWLSSCKQAMLTPSPKPTAAEDEEARHCLRTLPTLYEVQWLKKVSDFWSPEELQALRKRTVELGRDAAP